jgi:ubiquinone/menaquinone biosynthesis C-methylase UbiE
MTWQGKAQKRSFLNVKNFWESSGKKSPSDPRITIRDHYFRLLEIKEIRELIKGRSKVLDIGCGNGFSTIYYSQDVNAIVGADYSVNLIRGARQLLKRSPYKDVARKNNIEFKVADVTRLPFEDGEFDVIIGERLLINLPSWDMQKKAIREILRVLKRSGLYISVEVTEEGHRRLNYYRNMFGIEDMERYWHNLYLNEKKFLPFVSKYFLVSEIRRFGMYQFLSKVFYPLFCKPKSPKFISKFNMIAMEIGSKITNFGDCSHQVMFVLNKK